MALPSEHDIGRLLCAGPWRDCTLTMARIEALVRQALGWVRGPTAQ